MKASLLLALISAPLSDARKTYQEDRKPIVKKVPKLEAYDDSWCIFDTGKYSWCLDHNVDLQWGFEWIQIYSSAGTPTAIEYWRLRLHPYTEQFVELHPELNLENIFYHEITIKAETFKASVFAELMMWYNGHICWGVGTVIEDILITVIVAMKFQDCYKTIIESLTDWSQWTNGKLFDDCSPSNDEDITALTYNPITADWTYYFLNGVEYTRDTSQQCFYGVDWWPYAGFMPVYQSIFAYYSAVYGHMFAE